MVGTGIYHCPSRPWHCLPMLPALSTVGGAGPLPSVGPLPSSQQRALFVHRSLWGFPDGIPGLAGPCGESWYEHFPSLQLWVSSSRVADRKSKCRHLSGAWSDLDLPEPPQCARHLSRNQTFRNVIPAPPIARQCLSVANRLLKLWRTHSVDCQGPVT